jgi:hypothetical protein
MPDIHLLNKARDIGLLFALLRRYPQGTPHKNTPFGLLKPPE